MVSENVLIAAVVGVLIIAGAAYLMFSSKPIPSTALDAFAQCLSDNGAKMYGAWWCPHCQNQKTLFGDSWQFIDYTECSPPGGQSQLPVCAQAGIRGYPTWVFADNSRAEKEMSFAELAAKTSCPLPQ